MAGDRKISDMDSIAWGSIPSSAFTPVVDPTETDEEMQNKKFLIQNIKDTYIPVAVEGVANGVATLNSSVKVVQEPASKAQASGIASLDGSSKVVQDPANSTATPTASKIPIADGNGKLDSWTTATATPAASVISKSDTNGKLDSWITDGTTSAKGKVQLQDSISNETGKAITPNAIYAQITATPTGSKTPIADSGGFLDNWIKGANNKVFGSTAPYNPSALHPCGSIRSADITVQTIPTGTLWAFPCYEKRGSVISKLAVRRNSGGANGRAGIYSDLGTNRLPNSLLADLGSTTLSPSNGLTYWTANYTIPSSGVYWYVVTVDNGLPMSGVVDLDGLLGFYEDGSPNPSITKIICIKSSFVYGTLPSTFPTPSLCLFGELVPLLLRTYTSL